MGYYIVTEGEDNMNLFLVDRTKVTTRWWSYNVDEAIEFKRIDVARSSLNRLQYKNPRILTKEEAIVLHNANEANTAGNDHIFSNEALGQY